MPLALSGKKLSLYCFALAAAVVAAPPAQAAVFTASGGPLVDQPGSGFGEANFPLVISGVGADVATINSLTWTNITHSYIGDLHVTLFAPNGTSTVLYAPPDFDVSNLNGTYTLVENPLVPTIDEASASIADADIPSGTYAIAGYGDGTNPGPRTTFAPVVGAPVDGTWTLRVRDYGPGDTGALGSWSLDVTPVAVPEPAALGLFATAGLIALRRRRSH
jgi:hypothetical protein